MLSSACVGGQVVRLLVQVGQEMHLAGSIGPDTAARKLSLKVLAGTSRNIKSMFGKSSSLEVLGKSSTNIQH